MWGRKTGGVCCFGNGWSVLFIGQENGYTDVMYSYTVAMIPERTKFASGYVKKKSLSYARDIKYDCVPDFAIYLSCCITE